MTAVIPISLAGLMYLVGGCVTAGIAGHKLWAETRDYHGHVQPGDAGFICMLSAVKGLGWPFYLLGCLREGEVL